MPIGGHTHHLFVLGLGGLEDSEAADPVGGVAGYQGVSGGQGQGVQDGHGPVLTTHQDVLGGGEALDAG